MYFVLKALARDLVLPPAGPLILAFLGAWLVGRRRAPGWTLLLSGLMGLWLLSTPLVADVLSGWAERYPALDPEQPIEAQAIVILGGGGERLAAPEYHGPAADAVLLERLAYGAFLERKTALPILVSGTPTEALAMSATLRRDFGIQPRWIDDASHDTYQNAHFSVRLLRAAGISRIVLVSSSAHLWRAAHEFAALGMQVTPAPSGVLAVREKGLFRFVPGPTALARSHAALYELLGEPARQVLALLHVRENLDKQANPEERTAPAPGAPTAGAAVGAPTAGAPAAAP